MKKSSKWLKYPMILPIVMMMLTGCNHNEDDVIGFTKKSYPCEHDSSSEPVVFVAPNGRDKNNGSKTEPFATVNRAISDLAGKGGVIYLRGGLYQPTVSASPKFSEDSVKNAAIYVNRGGSQQQPLKICSYPGETAIIDGKHLNDTTTLFLIEDTQWVQVIGLEIRNARGRGLEVIVAENIALYGNNVHNNQLNGITVRGTMWGDVKKDRARNVLVEGNLVINNYKNNSGANKEKENHGQGLQARNAENIQFVNNKVVENWGEGVGLVSVNNATVQRNTIIDNYSVNLYFDNAQSSTAENNFIMATGNPATMKSDRDTNNIQMANERYDNLGHTPEFYLDKNTVRNNIIVGGHEGFHYGVYAGAHAKGQKAQFFGLRNTTIENNTFYGNHSLFNISEDPYTFNVNIKNNIFAKPTIQNTDGIISFQGLNFEQNNWYGVKPGMAASSSDVMGDPLLSKPGESAPTDYTLANNSPTKAAGIGATVKNSFLSKFRMR
ncbi:hypothetical protein STA3757_34740 [Stanieria sp. NIES-3757]|nr:hypothetical protein STA3757_34740 [Stanieria sp. NIES-3757]